MRRGVLTHKDLVKQLRLHLRLRNVDACCRVLRRIHGELATTPTATARTTLPPPPTSTHTCAARTPVTLTPLLHAVVQLASRRIRERVHTPARPSAPLSRSSPSSSLLSATPHPLPVEADSKTASTLLSPASCSASSPPKHKVPSTSLGALSCTSHVASHPPPPPLSVSARPGRTSRSVPSPSSVDILCYTAQRIGAWADALTCATALPHPPSSVFLASLLTPHNTAHVLAECTRRGWAMDVVSALRILGGAGGGGGGVVKSSSWIAGHPPAEAQAALRVAHYAEQHFPLGEPYRCGVLLPYLAAAGATRAAMQWFTQLIAAGALVERGLVRHVAWQTVCVHRQWRVGLGMLRVLQQTQETAALLQPWSASFATSLMGQSGSWQVGLEVWAAARAAAVVPDVGSMAVWLTQCEAAGVWGVAREAYAEAVREGWVERWRGEAGETEYKDGWAAAEEEDEDAHGTRPELCGVESNSVNSSQSARASYGTLLRALTRARQWERALEALSWMSKASDASRSVGLVELLVLCAQSHQWQAALAVGANLQSMLHRDEVDEGAEEKDEETDDEVTRVSARASAPFPPRATHALLLACAVGAQWQRAMQLYQQQVSDVRVTPHPMWTSATLQACAHAGRWAEALGVLHAARAAQPRVIVPVQAYRWVMQACMTAERYDAVVRLWALCQRDGLLVDAGCRTMALRAMAREGDWQSALQMLRRLPAHRRTAEDRAVVRQAARAAGPVAHAMTLRCLHQC